jgi:prepilin-type N-terminal cleavage/methylation domain-containing protein
MSIPQRRSQRGFTLVELLVVVSVFVVLVMMTVPNYLKTRPQRLLSGETNRMAGVIRQGRLFSLRDNAKVYLEFIPEIDTYRLWSASGWRAYADMIDIGLTRDPDKGHYNGDLDGDGDGWWGTGPLSSPTGPPEDPDVKYDSLRGWYYEDSDGTYLDLDVLLMPTYPGNQPIRTVSPRLRILLNPDTTLNNVVRDLSDTGGVAGDNVVPLDVDIRMEEETWDVSQPQPLGKRNGILSHFPLIFLVFFPDGTLGASWDAMVSTGPDDEVIDLEPGALGAAQVHLQVRGNKYNPEAYNLFDPLKVVWGDEGQGEPISAYDTLSLDESNSDVYGRVITVNNLTGRVIIRNFAPYTLDVLEYTANPTPYY